MNRQKLVLALLLAILGLALWYAYWASPRQERLIPVAGSPVKAKRAREVQPELTVTDKRRVRLEILERGVDAFSEPRRDIFRLAHPRPIAPAPAATPVVAAPQPMPVARPAMLPGSSVRFNVLGFLKKENIKTVFLSLGNEIFVVKEGDRFGKNREFEAEEITDEKLVVRQGDGTFPITVPLIDKRPSLPLSSPPPVGRFPAKVRPSPIQVDADDVEEEEVFEEDLEEFDQKDLEELDEEEPTEETESGNPAAGNMGSLPQRGTIQ